MTDSSVTNEHVPSLLWKICSRLHVTYSVFYVGPEAKVDFLGMSVDGAAAVAGQWILLVLGLVLLAATILLVYKYRKSKKSKRSSSQIELRQTS